MSVALDTNVIVYAFDHHVRAKQLLAQRLLASAVRQRAIVPRQVLGDLLNVAHRKPGISLPDVREAVRLIAAEMTVVATQQDALLLASGCAERFQLQFFDALICTISALAGARALLSEDMQDGQVIDGLAILNPFNMANTDRIEALLGSALP